MPDLSSPRDAEAVQLEPQNADLSGDSPLGAEQCISTWVRLCKIGDQQAADAVLVSGLTRLPRQARRFEAAFKTLKTQGITRSDQLRAWRLLNNVHPARPACWRVLPLLLCDTGQADQCSSTIAAATLHLPASEISRIAIKCAKLLIKLGHSSTISEIVSFACADEISTLDDALSLAEICAHISDEPGRRAALRRALEIDPGNLSIVRQFISMFQSADEYTIGDASAANVPTFGAPVPATRLKTLSAALLRFGFVDNAVSLLEEGVRLSSSSIKLHEMLARAYDRVGGRHEDARTHWRIVCEKSNSTRAWRRVIELTMRTNDLKETLAVSTMAVERTSFDPALQPLHLTVLKRVMNESSSSEDRSEAENNYSSFVKAIWQRGDLAEGAVSSVVEMLCENDRAPDACKLLTHRVRAEPRSPLRRLDFAKFLFNQGAVANALRQCQKAVALDGQCVPARQLLSQYLTLTGHPSEALRELLELPEPRAPEVRRSMARALAEAELQSASSRRWSAAKRRGKRRTATLLELLGRGDIGACMEGLRELGSIGDAFLLENMQKFYGYAHPPLEVRRKFAIREAARKNRSAEAVLRRLRWAMPGISGDNSRRSVRELLQRWPTNPEVAVAAHATLGPSVGALVAGEARELFYLRARCRSALLGDEPLQLKDEFFSGLKVHPILVALSQILESRRKGVGVRRMPAAVCVSGEFRDMSESWQTIEEKIIRPLRAHVFVHTWSQGGSPISGRMLHNEGDIRHFLRCLPYEVTTPQRFMQEFPSVARSLRSDLVIDESYLIRRCGATAAIVEEFSSLSPIIYGQASMRGFSAMTYGNCAVESLMRHFAEENNIQYEVVIRIRPDLIVESIDLPALLSTACVPGNLVTPPFPTARGVNDQFAAGVPAVMQLYATAWHCLEANCKCPWIPGQSADTPEGLLYGHLFLSGVDVVASQDIRTRLSRYEWEIERFFDAISNDLNSTGDNLRAAVLEGLYSWLSRERRRIEINGNSGAGQLPESIMNLIRRYPQLADSRSQ